MTPATPQANKFCNFVFWRSTVYGDHQGHATHMAAMHNKWGATRRLAAQNLLSQLKFKKGKQQPIIKTLCLASKACARHMRRQIKLYKNYCPGQHPTSDPPPHISLLCSPGIIQYSTVHNKTASCSTCHHHFDCRTLLEYCISYTFCHSTQCTVDNGPHCMPQYSTKHFCLTLPLPPCPNVTSSYALHSRKRMIYEHKSFSRVPS